jgi:hypothetical protein
MFPWMKHPPHEKLFRLFLYTIFISRSSNCSSSNSSSNGSSNNAVIFAAVVSVIINVIILRVIDYKRHIFVHLQCTLCMTGIFLYSYIVHCTCFPVG